MKGRLIQALRQLWYDESGRFGAIASSDTLGGVPPGVIMAYGAAAAPTDWLLCDGTAVSRTGANAALFAIVGTTFGVGDGSTTFNLPDLRQRFPLGKAAAGTGSTLGGTGGTIDSAPTHAVTQPGDHAALAHAGTAVGAHDTLAHTVDAALNQYVSTAGSDGPAGHTISAHAVTQPSDHALQTHTGTAVDAHSAYNPPFQVVTYIIKL